MIHGGRLQQYGTPLEVYARPANRVVADFMGLVNLVPGKVSRHPRRHRHGRGRPGLHLEVAMPGGLAPGDAVEVAIRPENIRLQLLAQRRRRPALPRSATARFLGNVSEYYATLASGQVLRVQTHPLQQFAVGDAVAVEIDTAPVQRLSTVRRRAA